MLKIVKSIAVIAFVAAIAVGVTSSYFSDEEKVAGNTFTAGTIDIELDGNNTETIPYGVADVKPGEGGNINFDIKNVGQNPVNVSKNLSNWAETTGSIGYPCTDIGDVSSEPECVKAQANGSDLNNIASQIVYDLSVEVYANLTDTTPLWHQTIYTDAEGKSLSDVYPSSSTYVDLGLIPVGGHMKVTQSYHLKYEAGNEYQGDQLTFDITFQGKQLTGEDGYASVVLEDKSGPEAWDILQNTDYNGVLKYKTQGVLFDFKFDGKAPLADHDYVLAVGYDADTNVNKKVASATSDGSGNITITGTMDTGSLNNAKAWLVPSENWNGAGINWAGWPGIVPNFLWETSLIDYTKN